MKCIVCGGKSSLFYRSMFDDRYGAPGYYSVYICNKCGFGRISPILKVKEIPEFYKRYYPLSSVNLKKIIKMAEIPSELISWLIGTDNITHRYITKDSNVLDIGSGSGVSLLEIKKMEAHAYGVEPDPNAQKIAKSLKLKVFNGFVNDNPFPKIKFDFVTGSQVIEHEPDPLHFLLAAKKKLKNNGKIILSFPNSGSLYKKIFARKWINWHIPYHINFFTKESFTKLAKKAGLRIIYIRTITPNIWTVLQIGMLFVKSDEGIRNPLWTVGDSGIFSKLINFLLFILITPTNRLFDFLGIGDSILVILKNDK